MDLAALRKECKLTLQRDIYSILLDQCLLLQKSIACPANEPPFCSSPALAQDSWQCPDCSLHWGSAHVLSPWGPTRSLNWCVALHETAAWRQPLLLESSSVILPAVNISISSVIIQLSSYSTLADAATLNSCQIHWYEWVKQSCSSCAAAGGTQGQMA